MPIRTIESVVDIAEDRRLVVQLPDDIPVGRHRVVTVLDEASEGTTVEEWTFPILEEAEWPAGMPLTREQMYGEHGR